MFESAFWNSGKVLEAEIFVLQRRNRKHRRVFVLGGAPQSPRFHSLPSFLCTRLSLASLQALYRFKTLLPYSLVDLEQMSAEDLTLQ